MSPCGNVRPDWLEQGIERIHAMGFRTLVGEHVLDQNGYLGGTDEARAADFNAMWANPEVQGIISSKGGYGSMRMLQGVDWDLVRSRPLFFCGFSDITGLHLAIQKEANLVTFHGPMITGWGAARAYNTANFLRAATSTAPLGEIPWPTEDEMYGIESARPQLLTIRGGKAQGRLVGGNLSLIHGLMGTPWEIDLTDTILMMEDVEEAPYRVDRFLTQLLLSGKMAGVRGIIFGDSPSCTDEVPGRPPIEQVVADRLGGLGIPVFYGYPSGHTGYRATLPLGVQVEIDADNGTLTVLESATVTD
ncbi:MAG TPA: LD-carboxypeptidase [Symbiobacteriaceae bacterium]|nr:LD-carboxypeptidase [Symbiobacteriaceae bacterium]